MIKLLRKNKFAAYIFVILIIWRLFLLIPEIFGKFFILERNGYIGSVPWANFDGIHYLSIAQSNYFQFEQAFFPLLPLLINIINRASGINFLISGILVVYVSLMLAVIFFGKLVEVDFNSSIALWAVIFLLFSPTSFFLGSIYTESLFLFFVFAFFYFVRKKNYLIASFFGAFASMARLMGIFLIPSLLIEMYLDSKGKNIYKKNILSKFFPYSVVISSGLFSYIYYLKIKYGDPFMFISSQSAFGAGRSGGEIILLPQVIWRYIKIFITVPFSNYDYWIALLEIVTFTGVVFALYFAYKAKIRKSYILFSLFSIFIPTLSGTFSSIPRYALSSFAVFIFFATIKNKKIKYFFLATGIILETLLSALFLRGYFVS